MKIKEKFEFIWIKHRSVTFRFFSDVVLFLDVFWEKWYL